MTVPVAGSTPPMKLRPTSAKSTRPAAVPGTRHSPLIAFILQISWPVAGGCADGFRALPRPRRAQPVGHVDDDAVVAVGALGEQELGLEQQRRLVVQQVLPPMGGHELRQHDDGAAALRLAPSTAIAVATGRTPLTAAWNGQRGRRWRNHQRTMPACESVKQRRTPSA